MSTASSLLRPIFMLVEAPVCFYSSPFPACSSTDTREKSIDFLRRPVASMPPLSHRRTAVETCQPLGSAILPLRKPTLGSAGNNVKTVATHTCALNPKTSFERDEPNFSLGCFQNVSCKHKRLLQSSYQLSLAFAVMCHPADAKSACVPSPRLPCSNCM